MIGHLSIMIEITGKGILLAATSATLANQAAEAAADQPFEHGHTQMPWVYYSNLQHNGAPFPGSVDRFVSYPAFHHALLIRTYIGSRRYSKTTLVPNQNPIDSDPGFQWFPQSPKGTYLSRPRVM